jgi:tetratricopeptide (TPR) repeat protein
MYGKLLLENAAKTGEGSLKQRYQADAEQHLERGLAIYPDYALAHGLLGKLAMDRKDYHAATDHFIACLERDTTEDVALKNLAFIGRRMGEANDQTGAERAFRAAIRFAPRTTEPYLFLADALMRTGRADSSIVLLDRLIAMRPGYADAFRLKGEIYAVYLKQPAPAEENFLKAHALAPNDLTVTDNLGVAAFQRQDYPRALSFFLKGIEVKPDDAPRLRNVSETYRRMGDEVKAAEFLQRAQVAERNGGRK